ncbi:hypothetical protein CHY_1841 [Carboxydothermus hydrogenoformans Z-2901]|uniref:Uncharacterized protein n=1 Tax=Carboxydothermus hydrogenoformans (strain ATCC BAA-161 / DSM 6008 / Z-2901) TaxID=246194 RepID=Q3AB23_CARHZ|nr:hypothetical protein CHY_1841 [Carboxydothermus hydrogenoformans Z-2901]
MPMLMDTVCGLEKWRALQLGTGLLYPGRAFLFIKGRGRG